MRPRETSKRWGRTRRWHTKGRLRCEGRKRLEPAAGGGGVTREADCRSSGAEASMKTLAQKQDNDIWHPLGRDGRHELTYLSTANKNNWDRQQEGRRNDDINWPLRTSALRRKGEEDTFNRRECPRSQLKCDRLVTTCSAERTPNLPDELYCNAIISL